ncbi:MAG TPA: hypothetical protein VGW10_01305 [Solirubrobacteraceae bacterium]|nr:hypothetical protein [Solirubrobacteraceae bacterium]
MTSAPVRTPPFTPRRRPTPARHLPTLEDIGDESLGLVTMPVIIPTIAPGFLLCVPGLVFVLFPVIVLAVAAAAGALAVAAAAGAVAVPLLVARMLALRAAHVLAAGAHRVRARRISSTSELHPALRGH